MVSIQIKMMMDRDYMENAGKNIYLGNFKDDDEKKIKIMVSIQIKMMMMDQDDMEYVGNYSQTCSCVYFINGLMNSFMTY